MNTKTIGLWAFFIGMVLALLTVFVSLGSWVTQVLLLLGILAGFFHHKIKAGGAGRLHGRGQCFPHGQHMKKPNLSRRIFV